MLEFILLFLDLVIRGVLIVAFFGGIYYLWFSIGQIAREDY